MIMILLVMHAGITDCCLKLSCESSVSTCTCSCLPELLSADLERLFLFRATLHHQSFTNLIFKMTTSLNKRQQHQVSPKFYPILNIPQIVLMFLNSLMFQILFIFYFHIFYLQPHQCFLVSLYGHLHIQSS